MQQGDMAENAKTKVNFDENNRLIEFKIFKEDYREVKNS